MSLKYEESLAVHEDVISSGVTEVAKLVQCTLTACIIQGVLAVVLFIIYKMAFLLRVCVCVRACFFKPVIHSGKYMYQIL